jgi:hypothetical protein
MSSTADWTIPPDAQPKPEDYGFDLDRALNAVVSVRANIPDDAFTAVVRYRRAGTRGDPQRRRHPAIGYLIARPV